jgi:hypothetical protein
MHLAVRPLFFCFLIFLHKSLSPATDADSVPEQVVDQRCEHL